MPKKSNSYRPVNSKGDLKHVLGSELNTISLRDKALGIKEGEIIHGVSWAKASQWRFLEENLNFIEEASSYHGEFIARVEVDYHAAYFVLIAWRPVFGKSQDYMRLAKLSHKPLGPIRLDNKISSYVDIKSGDLVEFVAKVSFEMNGVTLRIPIASLKLRQYKTQEEFESRAN